MNVIYVQTHIRTSSVNVSVKASCIANLLPCFFGTEVPGGDGPGPILQTTFLSRRTPQPNVRPFRSMARGWVLSFHRNVRPAHFAPLGWEEGLRSIEGQTLDHPSYQQRGERTAWKDDRHYTAAVQQWSSIPIILHFCLEPLAVQTLLVVVAIVSKKKKKRVFLIMHTKCKTFPGTECLFLFCFFYICVFIF